VDLRHYLTPAGTLLDAPRPARNLAEYFAHIVAQGSNYDEGSRCGVAAGRGGAHVLACWRFVPISIAMMVWHCPVCGDNGAISGWQGTFWDDSDIPKRSL
jgi:hypothetical protein